jgi:hypothetical protein
MKQLKLNILLIGGLLFLVVATLMRAENTSLPAPEFERLWATRVSLGGKVESFSPGKGDALVYQYDGYMHLCSDSIAIISVCIPSDDSKQPSHVRKLRISVPEGKGEQDLLRKVGVSIKLSVPLLYLKYDPWGFIPFTDLKNIVEDTCSGPR